MKILLNAFLSLLMPIIMTAQSITISTNPTLTYLYNSKNDIGTINNTVGLDLFSLKVGNNKAKYKLIKNKLGLYVLIDGTGQVYKASNQVKNNITFTRIDSTRFFGNNFESINFSYKETLYSLGGYGFWNRNGQLIHFTPGAEWSIDKINNRYHTIDKFYSYDVNKSKIYYVDFPWNEESTSKKTVNTALIEFDITKKENRMMGNINPKINLNFTYFKIDLPSLNGILSFYDRAIYLYSFSYNKVYKLINSKITDELISKANSELQTSFEDEGKIYYSFNNDTTLRSFTISMSDFKEEPYTFYIPENTENNNWLIIIICLITFSTIIINIRRKQKNKPITIDKNESYTVDLNSNEFNTIESTLINNLIEKSKIDSYLTVEELNSILGIKKKTIEIQKRVRTEAINRINHKFNINFNLETKFIERTRSVDDKRYFNYIINQENSEIYLKHSK